MTYGSTPIDNPGNSGDEVRLGGPPEDPPTHRSARANGVERFLEFLSGQDVRGIGAVIGKTSIPLFALWLRQRNRRLRAGKAFPDLLDQSPSVVDRQSTYTWRNVDAIREPPPPRMGRRIDAVLLIGGVVVVIEFQVGESRVERAALDQAWDYALDLKNFHEAIPAMLANL